MIFRAFYIYNEYVSALFSFNIEWEYNAYYSVVTTSSQRIASVTKSSMVAN